MDEVLIFKIFSFVLILATGLAGGIISLRISRRERCETFFTLGSAFAGGIFLGAGFLHLLPDANETLASQITVEFPLAALLCALGFLLILCIEKVVVAGHHILHDAAVDPDRCGAAYMLTFVLSVHSIITGIALGTEDTLLRSSVLLLAILAHKGSAAFALGVSLFRAGAESRVIKRIIVMFSFMTPLGLMLGKVMTEFMQGHAEQIVIGTFDALAAGTFLYVGIMDIITEEFSNRKLIKTKAVLLFCGLSLMAVLAAFV